MKKVLLAIIVLGFFACNKDDARCKKQIEKQLVGGIWRIEGFTNAGYNGTDHFSDYTFFFNNDGTMSATNGTINCMGKWEVIDKNELENTTPNIKLELSSPNFYYIEELNKEWSIENISSERFELKNKRNHSNHTDYLTLDKD